MCRTPEQVTLDFFASLRHQLSPNYRISKSIKDYARALNGISFTPFLGLSLNIHAVQGDSLYVKKKKLSDELAELPKPVIVFIDDLDRLEREEVFEVLRLIRNTADLSNLIYVVAYDKAYVRQVLEQKNIGNALAYLEKIFPVEVCLPMVEKYLIWEVLHSDIDAQANSDEFAKMLFQDFNTEDVELVLRILSTYRRAKRFARIYMLNMTYINRELQLEFNQVDLFWLILLQIHNPRAYEVLVYDPSILLKMVNNRWILKEGIIDEVKKDQSNNPHMGEGFWTSETHRLLDLLFGRNPKPLQQSVCFVENYDKYFALNISKYKLTFGELNSLLEGNDSPESIVREWIKTKNISSILYHLERVPTKEFKGKQVKRYLSAIFELGAAAGTYQYVKFKLSSQKYSTSQAENLQSIAMNWLSSEIESGDDSRLVELTGLLNWLYSPSSNERNEKSRSSIIISNKDIENLLENAMEQFLGRHPNLTALDIVEGFAPPAQSQLSGEHLNLNSLDPLDEKRILGTFFRNCCVQTDEDQETYIQAVFNVVIKHFSGKHIKPTLLEYQKAYDRAVSEYNLQSNNPQGNEYESNTNEELRFLHDSYFGTDNKLVGKVFLSRFKSECFSQDEQAVGSSPSGSETALSQEGQD